MTITELKLLLAALPEGQPLLFELLAHTGLRIGEAIELRWGRDLILDDPPAHPTALAMGRRTRVRAQDAYGKRDIPLSPGLKRKLLDARPPHADGRLVFSTSTGGRLNRHNLYRDVLGPTKRAVGLDWVTPHTFRHTCASLLFAPREHGGGGKNVKQVQEWLGHHSAAYTLKEYVHLIDTGVGEAAFLDDATAA